MELMRQIIRNTLALVNHNERTLTRDCREARTVRREILECWRPLVS